MTHLILLLVCLLCSVSPGLAEGDKLNSTGCSFQELMEEANAIKDSLVRKAKKAGALPQTSDPPMGGAAPSRTVESALAAPVSSGSGPAPNIYAQPTSQFDFNSCILSCFAYGFTSGYNSRASIIAENSILRSTTVSKSEWIEIAKMMENRSRCSADNYYAFWLDSVSLTNEQIVKMRAAIAQGFDKGSEAAITESKLPRYHFKYATHLVIDTEASIYSVPAVFEFAEKSGIPAATAAAQMRLLWPKERRQTK